MKTVQINICVLFVMNISLKNTEVLTIVPFAAGRMTISKHYMWIMTAVQMG